MPRRGRSSFDVRLLVIEESYIIGFLQSIGPTLNLSNGGRTSVAKTLLCTTILWLMASLVSRAAESNSDVIVYDGTATEVTASTEAAKDLWVTMKDLKRATRFVVKPQGVCRDELCFPLPKARKADFVIKKGAVTWFNLSAFARLVKQPAAHDDKNGVWYFGKREDERGAYLESLDAPDFSLPDLQGKKHSLSDYRGKKVLLITWASW